MGIRGFIGGAVMLIVGAMIVTQFHIVQPAYIYAIGTIFGGIGAGFMFVDI